MKNYNLIIKGIGEEVGEYLNMTMFKVSKIKLDKRSTERPSTVTFLPFGQFFKMLIQIIYIYIIFIMSPGATTKEFFVEIPLKDIGKETGKEDDPEDEIENVNMKKKFKLVCLFVFYQKPRTQDVFCG